MKINDIIMEKTSDEDREKLKQLQSRGTSGQALAKEIKKYLEQGFSWDPAADLARDELNSRRQKQQQKQQKKQQKQPATPSTSSTPQNQRDRKDTRGRNLQHDRYYRDKDSKEIDWDSPTLFDLPDDHFDFIPGVKTVKKAINVGKSAATKVRRAADRAGRLQNFSDKSRKKR